MFQAHIQKLTFADGTQIDLTSSSILVVIGPNNSGKSATLSDIMASLLEGNPSITLSSVQVTKTTTLEQILEDIRPFRTSDGIYRVPDHAFHEQSLRNWWKPEAPIGAFLRSVLVSNLSTRERLSDCDATAPFDARQPMSAFHPFQHMYRDPQLEADASAVVRRAFKKDLIIHRTAGQSIPAYVGIRPIVEAGEDRISLTYVEKVEKLDPLENQGDGIRSFVSVIGRVFTEARPMQLIDEPEAFLHPPQARLIAEEIARHSAHRQTFVATHSSDVLQGLLTNGGDRVSVVRLTRTAGQRANYLSNTDVSVLWKDPILRFGNVLDGLFHDGVIVTESDADCRFYETLANAVVPAEELPDLHYTYSGGKDRIPVLVKALAALKVPVASVLDFDVLNNDQPLQKIVEAHGGDWSSVAADWKAVKLAVESNGAFLSGDKFRQEITALLKDYGQGTVVPKEVLRDVKKSAKNASPWDRAKDSGLAGIASGQPTVAAKRLLETLATLGIFVVPVGEMEGFCRAIGGHGPRWVEEALKRDVATDSELESARRFSCGIVDWLNQRRSGGLAPVE